MPKRALYLSSPIGLGHARRDLAIANELRQRHPDLEIDWLAQHPVTAFLEAAGETIHPGSRILANESQHIEAEADGHDLHIFEAYRRMDEILVANFMVFQEIVSERGLDLLLDGDWSAAMEQFLRAIDLRGGVDEASQVMIERCREAMEQDLKASGKAKSSRSGRGPETAA